MTHEELAAYLREHHLGRENAGTNNSISQAVGMTDLGTAGRAGRPNSRRLTQLISMARLEGHPICADHCGIYYAARPSETTDTVGDFAGRAWKYDQQARALAAAALNMEVAIEHR